MGWMFALDPSGEDLHDGVTFERFLALVDNHPRCNILYDPSHLLLQQMDYLGFIDVYHSRIKAFHVKDAEYHASSRSGVYGGYQPWLDRAGRFRSLGTGRSISKRSSASSHNMISWLGGAGMGCCLKDAQTGAREGSDFIRRHVIPVSARAFDDFAAGDEVRK